MDLILTGLGVDGVEAERVGLVNRLAEPGGAMAGVAVVGSGERLDGGRGSPA